MWFTKSPKKALPPPVPALAWSGMTLERWRASSAHVQYARDLWQQPLFRDLLMALINSRPRPVSADISPTAANILLGVNQGYDLLLGQIFQLPSFADEDPAPVEATYGQEDFNINAAP